MNKIIVESCLRLQRCFRRRRALAQAPEPLSIVVFGPPSLGAFLPPVIKAQKLDEKNGLAIKFEERTPDAYTAQFNSGEFQLGGSASLLTVGLADIRGVKVTYLFNLFDFWGAVVTSRPEVKTLKDLEGKELAAAKGTTNYVMFDWFARQLGADTVEILRGQYRDARPDRLRAGRSRRRRAALGAGLYDAAVEEERHADDRHRDRRQLEEIHRQPQHSLSRRRRAYRLGGEEPEADPETLRRLQGSRRMGRPRIPTKRRS